MLRRNSNDDGSCEYQHQMIFSLFGGSRIPDVEKPRSIVVEYN